MEHPVFSELAKNGHVLSRDFTTREDIDSGRLENLVGRGIVYSITTNPTSNEIVYAKESKGKFLSAIRNLVETGITGATRVYDELFIGSIILPATAVLGHVNRKTFSIEYRKKTKNVLLQKSTMFLHGYASYEFRPVFTPNPFGKSGEEINSALVEIMRLSHLIIEKTGRKNFFIKVPATPAGIEAGERAISMGYNINFTLVASASQYEETVKAAIKGKHDYVSSRGAEALEKLGVFAKEHKEAENAVAAHKALAKELPDPRTEIGAESVSSDFVSRTDRAIDPLLLQAGRTDLVGKSGVAYAKTRIYPVFEEYFLGDGAKAVIGETWQKFAGRTGSRIQQIYWGSTGVKNPEGAYTTDPKYMGQLKAPGTTNTAPPEVIDALAAMSPEKLPIDASLTIWDDFDEAVWVLEEISDMGIDIEAQLKKVYADGLGAFAKSDAATFAKIENDIKNIIKGTEPL